MVEVALGALPAGLGMKEAGHSAHYLLSLL